ncbi:MAG TPA: MBL fold metallo-hydrolase [Gemmatimonadaceae bacterium]|nr:MBL fold metallo-hydrolase [Gemmatimonadaceae bacterium]
MIVRRFPVGAFQENTFLVVDETTGHAVLVDPGADADRLIAAVRASGASLDGIWLTHAHVDHVGAIAAIKRVWNVPVRLHPLDRPLYDAAAEHGRVFGVQVEAPPSPELSVAGGDRVQVGTLTFDVMHVPGHSPGHVVYHGHGVAFAGDCLFAGSIGRTDLPLSDPAVFGRSLERICALGDDVVIYPGHGPETTIGAELRTNPFLAGLRAHKATS